MSYTDVTKPVIISVTQNTSFSLENPLRQMAVISLGNSNITAGTFKELDISNYGDIITKDSITYYQISSFFSYAGNKPLILLELGASDRTAQIAFLKNILTGGEVNLYNIICPPEFFYSYEIIGTYGANMPQEILIADTTAKTLNLQLSGSLTSDKISIAYSTQNIIEIDLNAMTYKLVDGADTTKLPITATLSNSDGNFIGTLTFNAKNGTTVSYIEYSQEITKSNNDFQTLVQDYANFDSKFYFFIPVSQTEDPAASENIKNYLLKSCQMVFENSQKESLKSTGLTVGITASSYFDISASMPASSLNFKSAKGYLPNKYTNTLRANLINAPVTFIDTMASQNVILNGLQGDGYPWEYYYYWDLTEYRLKVKLTTLILSGANNPVSAIKFNQDGIDTIHQNLKTELNLLKEWGVISDFGVSYDSSTGTIQNSGEIYCPDYYAYIASNPDDYKKEILKGIYFYIQIGKFIRQVQINANIGA